MTTASFVFAALDLTVTKHTIRYLVSRLVNSLTY